MIFKVARIVALVVFVLVAVAGLWVSQCAKQPQETNEQQGEKEEQPVIPNADAILGQEIKEKTRVVEYSDPQVGRVRRNFVPSAPVLRRAAPTKESVGVRPNADKQLYFGASLAVKPAEKEKNSMMDSVKEAVTSVAGSKADQVVQAASKLSTEQPMQVASATVPVQSEPEFFAPTGRMIRCVLVNTLETSNIETPIVGYVAESFVWDGVEIIPEGTEVHGWVDPASYRDRIGAENLWRLVFHPSQLYPKGGSIQLNARVLHREESVGPNGGREWGAGDGSYGFKGVSVESLKDKRTMSLIAAAMAEAGRVFQERREVGTTGVSVVDQTARNAAYAGASAVLDGIVQRMEEEIAAHGIYTVVTGGSEFWLYVDQDLWFSRSEVIARTKPDHSKAQSEGNEEESLSSDPLERLKQQISSDRGIPITDFL